MSVYNDVLECLEATESEPRPMVAEMLVEIFRKHVEPSPRKDDVTWYIQYDKEGNC